MKSKTIKICIISVLIAILMAFTVSGSGYLLKQIIMEGDTIVYKVDDYNYLIQLLAVSDNKQSATFVINDEVTDPMTDNELYTLKDGTIIQVRDVMPNQGTPDLVQFNFFPADHEDGDTGATLPKSLTTELLPEIEPVRKEKLDGTEGIIKLIVLPREEPPIKEIEQAVNETLEEIKDIHIDKPFWEFNQWILKVFSS